MPRRLLSLLVTLVVLLTGITPVGPVVSAAQSSHGCCRTMQSTPAHDRCPQPAAATMSCCAPAPARGSDTQAPLPGASTAHPPDFTLLKGHAAHVPGLPDLVDGSVAQAFESARLKLPHAPIYLRNVVLLV